MATLVFLAVVGARFVVPLLIPRFPLPAIVAALVIDGVDQSVFQAFGYDPPGYQGYDKAMDVYYLAIAYLSTLRNWSSPAAVAVARFLYFYRLVGVVAFELTGWRALLLVFPNTFEYFFIAYEIVRSRYDPAARSRRFWLATAAVIWIVVKLPQEYWIHVAQLDVTDEMARHPVAAAAVLLLGAGLAVVAWLVVRPRLAPPDHPWRLAAEPVPAGVASAALRDRWRAAHGRVLSVGTAEKVVLVALISVVFAELLPDRRSGPAALAVGVGVFVVLNAAISLAVARRTRSLESLLAAFGVRVAMNAALVVLADWLLTRGGGDLDLADTLFFVLLLSLLTLLDDRYRPMYENRRLPAPTAATPTSGR